MQARLNSDMETCSFIEQNSAGQKILRVIDVHVATDFQ